MLAAAPERALLGVRAILLIVWLLLIGSLFRDPITPALTAAENTSSPFRVTDAAVVIQGESVHSEPYALGNRVFWSMVVPLVPLFLLVAGHEAWRRICPLSFVSQIPRLLGLQRRRRKLNRRTGAVEAAPALPARRGWWHRHALDIQLFLLFLALNARILFVNADRTALAAFLIGLLLLVLMVGWAWGGKTWCNYLCPLGTVQKVYTGPGGLLESRPHLEKPSTPQSMCRLPAAGGDRSACVGCTPACPDVDRERSYWESLQDPSVRRLYYGLFGLIVGFYGFHFLYSGGWDYYFSGIWNHEPDPLSKLLKPGLYLGGQMLPIPKVVTAPLVLASAVLLSYGLWSLIERAYRGLISRVRPSQSGVMTRHQVLTVCAFACINTFYLFAGRANLALLPTQVVRAIDIAIVLLTTTWMVLALRRTPDLHRQESVSASLRGQLEKTAIDFPALLDGRALKDLQPGEVYVLARTLPEFTHVQRMQAYRSLIEDLIETHRLDSAASEDLLNEMRRAIGITNDEHREIMLALGVSDAAQTNRAQSAVFENWLRRDNYRLACEALLLGRLSPGRALRQIIEEQEQQQPLHSLMELYQISAEEHEHALAEIAGPGGLLYERAIGDLDQLAAQAQLAFNLQAAALTQPALQDAAALLLHAEADSIRPAVERLLATLAALGPSPTTAALAHQLWALGGNLLEQALEAPPTQAHSASWADLLDQWTLRILQGDLPDGLVPRAAGLVPYQHLVTRGPPLATQLEALIRDGSAQSALALWLLASLAPERAEVLGRCSSQDGLWMRALRQQLACGPPFALPASMAAAMVLSRCELFSVLGLERLRELADFSQTERHPNQPVLFQTGEPAQALIVLATGRYRILPDGPEFEAREQPGPFGAHALLHPCAHEQGLQVISDSAETLSLPRAEVSGWLLGHPEAAAAVFTQLAETVAAQRALSRPVNSTSSA